MDGSVKMKATKCPQVQKSGQNEEFCRENTFYKNVPTTTNNYDRERIDRIVRFCVNREIERLVIGRHA